MTVNQLIALVNRPETHQLILGEYRGGYALGVTDNPPAFHLRVEAAHVDQFKSFVEIDGQKIPVVVVGNYRTPRPQGALSG